MSRRVAISSNAAQNLDIQNLRDKTQGLDYKKDVVSLTGPQGGKLASKTTALTWDAQGNVVIPNKLQLGNADLQTTLDGKQPKGDYTLKPEFTEFQTKVANDLKGYVQKPELATYQTKVANDLKGYVQKPELATYQTKVANDLKGYVPKPEFATYQTKVANDLKGYALVGDLTKVSESLKGFQQKGDYALAGDILKLNETLKTDYALKSQIPKDQDLSQFATLKKLDEYAQLKQLDELKAQIPKPQDLSQYAQLKQLDELKTQIPKPQDLSQYAQLKQLDELKTQIPKPQDLSQYAQLKQLDELKAQIPKPQDLSQYAQLKQLDELKAQIPKPQDLSQYAPLKKLDEYATLAKLNEYAKNQELAKLQASVDSLSKVNINELSDKVKSLDLSQYPKKDELSKLVPQQDLSAYLKQDARGNVKVNGSVNFEADTDSASIGLKDYGGNRKDLAITWADDDDDKLRLIHRHHKDGEKEMMFIDRGSSSFPQPVNFKGGSSVHNPDNWQTHFPWAGDNKNYIRGDTELRGNLNNIGDIDVGGKLRVGGKEITSGGGGSGAAGPLSDKALYFRNPGDTFHGVKYGAKDYKIDGPVMWGNAGLGLGYNGENKGVGLRLDNQGSTFLTNDTNPIKFSANWTSFPDDKQNASEISNDTGNYKKLMIVGNKSAGAERRVGVWDRLDVHGNLGVDGSATVAGRNILAELDELKKRPVGSGGAAFDGAMNDKQLRLRAVGDGNHYVGFSGAVDGVRVQGHQGGQLGTNRDGDRTALRWDHNRNIFVGNDIVMDGDYILHLVRTEEIGTGVNKLNLWLMVVLSFHLLVFVYLTQIIGYVLLAVIRMVLHYTTVFLLMIKVVLMLVIGVVSLKVLLVHINLKLVTNGHYLV
jgi:hypothetical protein